MLLTVISLIFSVIAFRINKAQKQIKIFIPILTLLLGTYILAITPLDFMYALLGAMIIISFTLYTAYLYKNNKLRYISQKTVNIILLIVLITTIYTQFFNGLETFYNNPQEYFQYYAGVVHKYYFIPPKIIRIKEEQKDYIYSITQYKNSFFMPETLTQIEIYEGNVCYYWAQWRLGKVPYYYRRYFKDNSFIDSPA